MKFSTLNVDVNSQDLDPVRSKWPAHDGIEDGYPLSRYFTAIGCVRPVMPSGECTRNAIDSSFIIIVSNVNC